MNIDNVIIGAGLSGITLAERLANSGEKVLIIEQRSHIGGNCYDCYDDNHILIQKYGPHIFHTSHEDVWKYLNKFSKWIDYKHKVLTSVNGKLLPMPINRETINRYFGLSLKTEEEVKDFLENKRDKNITDINNSRDVVVSKYGEELYDAFIKNYTKKQWDLYPEELDKEVLERLPVRYDDNPYYFNDLYQGIPEHGFTKMFEKMLESKNIKIMLNVDYKEIVKDIKYSKLFVTSPVDEYFNFKYGKLKYRGINYEFEYIQQDNFQKNSVVNYPNDHEYTRITEMKKLTMQQCYGTTICKEFTTWEGDPSYPVPQKEQLELHRKYVKEAEKLKNVYFLGRLGSYKYLNMDAACKNALDLYKSL